MSDIADKLAGRSWNSIGLSESMVAVGSSIPGMGVRGGGFNITLLLAPTPTIYKDDCGLFVTQKIL